jgi:hypothetical protein
LQLQHTDLPSVIDLESVADRIDGIVAPIHEAEIEREEEARAKDASDGYTQVVRHGAKEQPTNRISTLEKILRERNRGVDSTARDIQFPTGANTADALVEALKRLLPSAATYEVGRRFGLRAKVTGWWFGLRRKTIESNAGGSTGYTGIIVADDGASSARCPTKARCRTWITTREPRGSRARFRRIRDTAQSVSYHEATSCRRKTSK